jgi:ComF family protein
VGVYQHALKEVIHQLKYKGKNQLAKGLGRILFFDYQRLWARNEVDLVLPIPLHPRRQRQRGFNQAYLLVKEWPTLAQRFTPCASTVFVEHRLLHRKRWTDPQVGLDHLKRLQNVRGAFEIKSHNHFIKGKKVLLVDDVYTTGATVSECAKLLMRKGAARVDVLTLAKAVQ